MLASIFKLDKINFLINDKKVLIRSLHSLINCRSETNTNEILRTFSWEWREIGTGEKVIKFYS